jgi:predicted ArsR family transcriptional regulator
MAELHPTRTRIVRLIREQGSATLSDLRRRTGLSRSTLRQHLAILAHDGLIASQFVRRPTGRPPLVYRLTARSELPPAQTYAAFLRTIVASMRAAGPGRIDALFRQIAQQLASEHPEIRRLADPAARLAAARRLFFPDAESTEVEQTDDGVQFSLYTCPLAAVAMEYRDLCCAARGVLSALVGEDVGQTEWILRGDPRCTFELRPRTPGRLLRIA